MDLSLGHEDVLSLLRIFAVDGPAQLEKLKAEATEEAATPAAHVTEEAPAAESAAVKCVPRSGFDSRECGLTAALLC